MKLYVILYITLSCWTSLEIGSNEAVYICPLTHCGLVTPYGDIDLGQHSSRQWLVAWQHQAITWTNVDFPEGVQRHSSENNFTWSAHKLNLWHVFGNYTLPVTTTSPRDQWVNIWNKNVRFAVLPVVLWVIYNVSWTMKIWGPPPT